MNRYGIVYYNDLECGIIKETDDGSLVLDKIITSMYSTDDSGNIYSFLKTYNFSNINSTTITYPDGVGI